MLVDLDLRKRWWRTIWAWRNSGGVLSVLEGRAPLSSQSFKQALARTASGPSRISVFVRFLEWMASQTMAHFCKPLKGIFVHAS